MNFIIGFLDRFADQLEEISKTSQKFHIAAPMSEGLLARPAPAEQ